MTKNEFGMFFLSVVALLGEQFRVTLKELMICMIITMRSKSRIDFSYSSQLKPFMLKGMTGLVFDKSIIETR